MSRQSRASYNSRPASSYQSVSQQSTISYSPPSNAESVAATSDLYPSRYDYGRVRESRNVLGKYLTSRGRQARRETKESANSRKERERIRAEDHRKELVGRYRYEEARRREISERKSGEEDEVQEERRVLAIEGNGGWYQHDREREEERKPRRPHREISRTRAASPPPPRQRLQKRNREEERVRQRNNLKRENLRQEGETLRENYRYREGEGLGEENQPFRLISAWERGFDVQREDTRRWVLESTYQSKDYPVVPLRDRKGSSPPIPLLRNRPSGPQLHRLAPSSVSSQSSRPPRSSGPQLHRPAPSSVSSLSSQSSQRPRSPRFPQPHPTPQSTQSLPLPDRHRRPAPSRRRHPAPSSPYDTNTLPRTKIEHNSPPPSLPPPSPPSSSPSFPPPRKSHHRHRHLRHRNPNPPERRSSSRGRSHPPASTHALTIENIARHTGNRHSSINNNPAATKHSRSKHNENKNPSINNTPINNTPTAKERSNFKDRAKNIFSRSSRIRASGKARVKDCVRVGAVVGKAGADAGRLLCKAAAGVADALED
ncbi:uncharacterized protein EAE98_008476 [Botrytis deweyae]|uniref:Uncharacterized protein n=1 Tax=Botrytis deweyae TaxID=2478750 RepID=A0ABQ7IEB9_9HELO|nr:uncharacterized protein EAE98_008476 [Botrytis deweyae]KAF7921629.1 hypothetical protein EAE98_008476 [Botrytis deweyae]